VAVVLVVVQQERQPEVGAAVEVQSNACSCPCSSLRGRHTRLRLEQEALVRLEWLERMAERRASRVRILLSMPAAGWVEAQVVQGRLVAALEAGRVAQSELQDKPEMLARRRPSPILEAEEVEVPEAQRVRTEAPELRAVV
jgi:hypothetical protein